MKLFALLFSFSLATGATLSAQSTDTIRICTYKVPDFEIEDLDRFDELRTVLNEIRPTLLAIQSRVADDSSPSRSGLLFDSITALLDIPLYEAKSFSTPKEAGVHFFVDATRLEFVRMFNYDNELTPHEQSAIVLRIRATNDTLVVMSGDWKVGSERMDELLRIQDAEDVIDQLLELDTFSSYRLFAGSMNLTGSGEDAYQALVRGARNDPRLIDPIARYGEWTDNPDFSDILTDNTRIIQVGDSTYGGLSNRSDLILMTKELLEIVRPESYRVFGNDGEHFNRSINDGTNGVVSPEMAQTLHDASDHLPVFVDLVFDKTSSVQIESDLDPEKIDLSQL